MADPTKFLRYLKKLKCTLLHQSQVKMTQPKALIHFLVEIVVYPQLSFGSEFKDADPD